MPGLGDLETRLTPPQGEAPAAGVTVVPEEPPPAPEPELAQAPPSPPPVPAPKPATISLIPKPLGWVSALPTFADLTLSPQYTALSPTDQAEARGQWTEYNLIPKLAALKKEFPDPADQARIDQNIASYRRVVRTPDFDVDLTTRAGWYVTKLGRNLTNNPAQVEAAQKATPPAPRNIQGLLEQIQALDAQKVPIPEQITATTSEGAPAYSFEERIAVAEQTTQANETNKSLDRQKIDAIRAAQARGEITPQQMHFWLGAMTSESPPMLDQLKAIGPDLALTAISTYQLVLAPLDFIDSLLRPDRKDSIFRGEPKKIQRALEVWYKHLPESIQSEMEVPSVSFGPGGELTYKPKFSATKAFHGSLQSAAPSITIMLAGSMAAQGIGTVLGVTASTPVKAALANMIGFGFANGTLSGLQNALSVQQNVERAASALKDQTGKRVFNDDEVRRLADQAQKVSAIESMIVSGTTQAAASAFEIPILQRSKILNGFRKAVADHIVKSGMLAKALGLGATVLIESGQEFSENGLLQAISTRQENWAAGGKDPLFGEKYWDQAWMGAFTTLPQTLALGAMTGPAKQKARPVIETPPQAAPAPGQEGAPAEGAAPAPGSEALGRAREILKGTGLEDFLGGKSGTETPNVEPSVEGVMPKRPLRPSKPPPHPPAKAVFQKGEEGGQHPTPTRGEGEFAAEGPTPEPPPPAPPKGFQVRALPDSTFGVVSPRGRILGTYLTEQEAIADAEAMNRPPEQGPAPRPTPPPATVAVSPPSEGAAGTTTAGPETGPSPSTAAAIAPEQAPTAAPPQTQAPVAAPVATATVAPQEAVPVEAPPEVTTPSEIAPPAPRGPSPSAAAGPLPPALAKAFDRGAGIAQVGAGITFPTAAYPTLGDYLQAAREQALPPLLEKAPPELRPELERAFDRGLAGGERPADTKTAQEAAAPPPEALEPVTKPAAEASPAAQTAPERPEPPVEAPIPGPEEASEARKPAPAAPTAPPPLARPPVTWIRAPLETVAASTRALAPSGKPERIHYVPPENDHRFDPQRAMGPSRAPVKSMGFAFQDAPTAAGFLSEADLSAVEDGTNLVQVALDLRNPFEVDEDHIGEWLTNPQVPAGHDSLLLHSNPEMSARGLAPKLWVMLGSAEGVKPLGEGELPTRGRPPAKGEIPIEFGAWALQQRGRAAELAKLAERQWHSLTAAGRASVMRQVEDEAAATAADEALGGPVTPEMRGQILASMLLDQLDVGTQPVAKGASKAQIDRQEEALAARNTASLAAEAFGRAEKKLIESRAEAVSERLTEARKKIPTREVAALPAERPGPGGKAAESRGLAERIAEFQRQGGKIQRIETPEVAAPRRATPRGGLAALRVRTKLETPSGRAAYAEVKRRLIEDFRRWLGESEIPVVLKVFEHLESDKGTAGRYLNYSDRAVIKLILDQNLAPEAATSTLFHESWHHIEETSLTKEQRTTLDKLFAPGTKGFEEVEGFLRETFVEEGAEEVLRDMRADNEIGRLEAHAYAAQMWLGGHRFGGEADSLIARIAAALHRLREWLRGRSGYETADALFAALESGELAKQSAKRAPATGKPLRAAGTEKAAEGTGWMVSSNTRAKYKVYINPSPEQVTKLPPGAVALLLNNGDILAADADPFHADLLNVAYQSGLWEVKSFPRWVELLHYEGAKFVFRGTQEEVLGKPNADPDALDRAIMQQAAEAIKAAKARNPGLTIQRTAASRRDLPLGGLKALAPKAKDVLAAEGAKMRAAEAERIATGTPTKAGKAERAGNIKISSFNTPDELKGLFARYARTFQDILDSKRMTEKEMIALAAEKFNLPAKLFKDRLAHGVPAAKLIAMAAATEQAAAEHLARIDAAEDELSRTSTISPATIASMVVSGERAAAIYEQLTSDSAEIGRALGALQTAAKLDAQTKTTLRLLDELPLGLGGVQGAKVYVKKARAARAKGQNLAEFAYTPGYGDVLLEMWKNGMVSGLSTLHVNNVSNISRAVARPIEVLLKAIDTMAASPENKTYFREAAASAAALVWSSYEALQVLLRTYATDESSRPWHVTEGKLGSTHRKAMTHPSMPAPVRAAGRVLRFFGYTSLQAWDDALKVTAQRQRTWEMAIGFAIRNKAAGGSLIERAAAFTKNMTPEEIIEARVDFPERQTSTRPPQDPVTKGIIGFQNRHPILSVATGLFFIKTMADLAHTGVEYSPLAPWLSPAAKKELEAGGSRRTDAIARMQFGFGLYMLGFFLSMGSDDSSDGDHRWLTGGGWFKDAARGRFKAESAGVPRYSFWDPLSKKWRPYWPFSPFAPIIMLGADAGELVSAAVDSGKSLTMFGPSYERNPVGFLAAKAVNSYFAAGFSSMWMGNLLQFGEALSGDPYKLKTYVGRYLSLAAPKVATQLFVKGDVFDRETIDFFDGWKETFGVGELYPGVTPLGRPKMREGNLLTRLMAQAPTPSPWSKVDERIGLGLGEKGIYIDKPERTYEDPRTGKRKEYTHLQWFVLQSIRGERLRPTLDALVRNKAWMKLRQDLAADQVGRVVGMANSSARAQVLGMDDLKLRAAAMKIENEARKHLEAME